MREELKVFDASEYLVDNEAIAEYLIAVIETGEQAVLLSAIVDIARAIGMRRKPEEKPGSDLDS